MTSSMPDTSAVQEPSNNALLLVPMRPLDEGQTASLVALPHRITLAREDTTQTWRIPDDVSSYALHLTEEKYLVLVDSKGNSAGALPLGDWVPESELERYTRQLAATTSGTPPANLPWPLDKLVTASGLPRAQKTPKDIGIIHHAESGTRSHAIQSLAIMLTPLYVVLGAILAGSVRALTHERSMLAVSAAVSLLVVGFHLIRLLIGVVQLWATARPTTAPPTTHDSVTLRPVHDGPASTRFIASSWFHRNTEEIVVRDVNRQVIRFPHASATPVTDWVVLLDRNSPAALELRSERHGLARLSWRDWFADQGTNEVERQLGVHLQTEPESTSRGVPVRAYADYGSLVGPNGFFALSTGLSAILVTISSVMLLDPLRDVVRATGVVLLLALVIAHGTAHRLRMSGRSSHASTTPR